MDPAVKDILRFIAVVVCIVVLSGLTLFFSGAIDITTAEKFAIVDRYQNCDVVRYETHGRYYYFLHCE